MIVLVVNAGSSSVKFTCIRMSDNLVLAGGLVERIGLAGTRLNYKNYRGHRQTAEVAVTDTRGAVAAIAALLVDPRAGVVRSLEEITAVGHRVVHGGEKITASVIIDARVKAIIEECFELAPLHNPPNLAGILASEEHFPGRPQVGVFDTAFHATIPPHAFLYGLPYHLYREDRIRRYGFHGVSHKYVAHQAAAMIGRSVRDLKIITCHLGNGCSITAVDGGRSKDTSMGMTPLEGLIMGTRCGDLDPAIVFYLMEHKKLDRSNIDQLLNKESGLLGLAEIGSSDLRDILAARDRGQTQAGVALEAFCYRVKKYIGAYAAVLGTLDALVFTAGIGENSPVVREMACANLTGLGIIVDPELNQVRADGPRQIQSAQSRVKVMVIPTNEEWEIAHQTVEVLEGA